MFRFMAIQYVHNLFDNAPWCIVCTRCHHIEIIVHKKTMGVARLSTQKQPPPSSHICSIAMFNFRCFQQIESVNVYNPMLINFKFAKSISLFVITENG